MKTVPTASHRRVAQRGLSLVESMIGLAIGLFVVGIALTGLASQLGENRRQLLHTQLQQDLRAVIDLVTRDLRRAGHADPVLDGLWLADRPQQQPQANPWRELDLAVASAPVWRYARGGEQVSSLSLDGGIVYRRFGSAPRQPMTDRQAVAVTVLSVTMAPGSPVVHTLACPALCDDGSQACWPQVSVRELQIVVEGRSAADAAIVQRLSSRVRLRNDAIGFRTADGRVCP